MHRHRERAVVDRIVGGVLSEQRDFERAPPRRRQQRQDVVEDTVEQVAEPDVGKLALRLRRPGREDTKPLRARIVDRRQPERRLPDPRLAFEDERSQPAFPPCTDEGVELLEQLLPADDLD